MNSFDLCVIDLEESLGKLKKFRNKFKSTIRTKTHNLEQQSLQYLQGILLEKGRGNMTKYVKEVPDTNNINGGEPDPIEVQNIADQLDPSEYQRVFLRDTERKEL
ncbi:MAG: hypothetical protein E4G94_04025 [ANME-2 cluster archaeon]|nr:MAG: hypothetical protein E4G94_04025 [ANME-2 cluster archaeon]